MQVAFRAGKKLEKQRKKRKRAMQVAFRAGKKLKRQRKKREKGDAGCL